MCGIVGYIGPGDAKSIVISGLKRLEYRGYDSSGIAFIDDDSIIIKKKSGKVSSLDSIVKKDIEVRTLTCGLSNAVL